MLTQTEEDELRVSDSLVQKLETYRAGLTVNMPFVDEDAYYTNFETEFRNFWINSSYYCILAGMGWYPVTSLPKPRYRPDALAKSRQMFETLKKRSALRAELPTNDEFLSMLHGRESVGVPAAAGASVSSR